MWVATANFMKALGSISRNSLWEAPEKCGIEPQYISLLRRLFAEQKGTVSTDRERDVFEMKEVIEAVRPIVSPTQYSKMH